MVFNKIKKAFASKEPEAEEYLEIDLGQDKKDNKVLVKLFVLTQYEDVNTILTTLREGFAIAIIDIKVLRKKDPIELKRAVSKIKKTSDAMDGNIAGFGENLVIVTPSFAKIQKENIKSQEDSTTKFDTY